MSDQIPDRVGEALRGTPAPRCAYVYDRAILQANAAALRAALPEGSTLLYAVKANGHPDVLAALASEVDGFEVASGGELALARIARAGVGTATQITFGGPAKTDGELAAAVECEATVNVESALELRRLAVAAESAGIRVRTALRVNRGEDRARGVASGFGIDEAGLAAAVEVAWGHPSLRLVGFACHAGGTVLDAEAHAGYVADVVRWSVAASARHGVPLDTINVGGGMGVDETQPGPFDLDTYAAGLAEAAALLPTGVQLIFESGRLLTADAGWYAAEVVDLKRTHGRWLAVLRGGTHHFRLPAARGYSNPFTVLDVESWPYPYDRPEVRDVRVDAVGELGAPCDVLTRDQPVRRLRVGDVLVFARAGAYGWDISAHEYLRHDPPEFLILSAPIMNLRS